MKPKFITFTGFDDRTNLKDMKDISKNFPVEWGILASPTNKDARFPSRQAIEELCATASLNGMNLSLHCCGSFSKGIQLKTWPNIPIRGFTDFKRIQLNGKIQVPKHKITNLLKLAEFNDFIIQCKNFHDFNKPLSQLFDLSGGRGIIPKEFPEHPGYLCGYAGGIFPDNVIETIKRINAPDGAEYWLDMETSVRTNGWFDLKKVASVCVKVFT